MHLRRNSTDPLVARQLMEFGEYDFVRPDMEHATILDAGANCGIASLIFAFTSALHFFSDRHNLATSLSFLPSAFLPPLTSSKQKNREWHSQGMLECFSM